MKHALNAVDKLVLSMNKITTSTSGVLDCIGARFATLRIGVSAQIVTNPATCNISLLESDDTVVSNYATIVADRAEVLGAAHHEVRYEVDLKSRKRYLKLIVTPGTTVSNDAVAMMAIGSLTRNEQDPASTTAMQNSTNDAVVVV